MGSILSPNCVIAKVVSIAAMSDSVTFFANALAKKTGETHYYVQLTLPDNGCAIKGLMLLPKDRLAKLSGPTLLSYWFNFQTEDLDLIISIKPGAAKYEFLPLLCYSLYSTFGVITTFLRFYRFFLLQ